MYYDSSYTIKNEMCAHNVKTRYPSRGSPPQAPLAFAQNTLRVWRNLPCIPYTFYPSPLALATRQLGQLAPSLLPVQPLVFLS